MKTQNTKFHSEEVEVAVAKLFDYRAHTIVPNVSWGLNLNHECDLLVLDKNERFTEVEIKVSVADLKKDFEKWHNHDSKFISRLVYAMPVNVYEKAGHLIPEKCGIILVERKSFDHWPERTFVVAKWHRRAKHDKTKAAPTQTQIRKFMHLGCMRIWALKARNNK